MQGSREEAEETDIDLFGLLSTLWNRRWLVTAITAAFGLAGVAYALLSTVWYRAEVVIVQADNMPASAGLGQLGGLASLAGISIGGGGASQTPIAVLKSRDFAQQFIEEEGLLTIIFADKWDTAASRWKTADPSSQPDIRDAVRVFDEKVRAVSEDKKAGLVKLSITWKDPALSAKWANLLVTRVNDRLRKSALAEAAGNIKYLQSEMATTNVTALQLSIGKVLESEMQKLLLAKAGDEYAFKIIDHTTVPKKRVKPQRGIVIAASLFIGLVLSAFCVLILQAWALRR